MRPCACIAGLLPVFLAVGATASILEMTPPIRGLALGSLRDMFEEIHNGHPHEAIDIPEPRGTPVRAVVSGTVRKLFLSIPGGNTNAGPDALHGVVEAAGRTSCVKPERTILVGFSQSVGMNSRALLRVDDAIRKTIKDGKIPGAVCIIGHKGKIVYRKAFGQRAMLASMSARVTRDGSTAASMVCTRCTYARTST